MLRTNKQTNKQTAANMLPARPTDSVTWSGSRQNTMRYRRRLSASDLIAHHHTRHRLSSQWQHGSVCFSSHDIMKTNGCRPIHFKLLFFYLRMLFVSEEVKMSRHRAMFVKLNYAISFVFVKKWNSLKRSSWLFCVQSLFTLMSTWFVDESQAGLSRCVTTQPQRDS